jgi:uncharacterized protein (TIGR00299 family) protein
MKTLAFDGRTGASGDMILGALIAAGADSDVLRPVETTLDVRYEINEVVKSGISSTSVEVVLTDDLHGEDDAHDHDHDENHHTHDGDEHDSGGHEPHAEGAGPHRSYREVCELVASMGLDPEIEERATEIFTILGEAEAAVHGEDLDTIHFHEVGADDAIADIVGAVLLLLDLDPNQVVTTPLATGGGTVEMSHGTYPVPGPAVVEIAEQAEWSIRGGPIERELLTPTGAAILAVIAEGVETLPELRVSGVGYGAGNADFSARPNVLRAIYGTDGGLIREEITVLETNVDDASPEILGGLQETLVKAGARDVSILPATMKKARPGHLVKVICRPEDARQIARRLAAETGTLGVRAVPGTHRWIAHRKIESIEIEFDGTKYELDMKIASDDSGKIYDVSAEYDDAAHVADETGRPIREVLGHAESAWRTGG